MHNQFKPGDLAIIINATVLTQNIGMCCELVRLLMPGEECLAPDGDVVFWPPEKSRSVWMVAGNSIVGRKALIAENEQLREDHDKQLRLAQSGIQNTEAVLAENAKLRTESEAMASLLRRFVENEHNPSEDQNERHWYHGEAETLLAKISGKHRDYALVPEESLQKMVSERDQLRAEVKALRAQPAVQKILDLILDQCRYWHGRDEARRGGFAILYSAAKEVADAAMGKGGRADG